MLYHNSINDLNGGHIDMIILNSNIQGEWQSNTKKLFRDMYPRLYEQDIKLIAGKNKPKLGSISYLPGERKGKRCCLVCGYMSNYLEEYKQEAIDEKALMTVLEKIKENCNTLIGYPFEDIRIGFALDEYYTKDIIDVIEEIIKEQGYTNITVYQNKKDPNFVGF